MNKTELALVQNLDDRELIQHLSSKDLLTVLETELLFRLERATNELEDADAQLLAEVEAGRIERETLESDYNALTLEHDALLSNFAEVERELQTYTTLFGEAARDTGR